MWVFGMDGLVIKGLSTSYSVWIGAEEYVSITDLGRFMVAAGMVLLTEWLRGWCFLRKTSLSGKIKIQWL